MVKRYDMDSEQWEDFIKTVPREETDGNFVYYTDHAAEMDKLRARLEVAVGALEAVNGWKMPETGRHWDDGEIMSYGACFGSNGERDFIRNLSREALDKIRGMG